MEDEGGESKIVQRASDGDSDAFAQLFHQYYEMIYGFAYRICLHPMDAEEIAQETFVKAARAMTSISPRKSFKPWLYRIAHNTAIDFGRAKSRRERLAEAVMVNEASRAEEHPADYSLIAEALGSLPEDLRSAIVLTFHEGMSHADVLNTQPHRFGVKQSGTK